jgi:hypothetical protein
MTSLVVFLGCPEHLRCLCNTSFFSPKELECICCTSLYQPTPPDNVANRGLLNVAVLPILPELSDRLAPTITPSRLEQYFPILREFYVQCMCFTHHLARDTSPNKCFSSEFDLHWHSKLLQKSIQTSQAYCVRFASSCSEFCFLGHQPCCCCCTLQTIPIRTPNGRLLL